MCQKSNIFKHFFVVVNHPVPLAKPYVLGVIKRNPFAENLFEESRNKFFFGEKEVTLLGINPPKLTQAYLLPIQIPRDWFLH